MEYSWGYIIVFDSQSKECDLARAAAKASSWNGFGCALIVRPLQVLVRVVGTCAMACPVVRWHVKLRQAGATPWASGVIATNVCVYAVRGIGGFKNEAQRNVKPDLLRTVPRNRTTL